ncbi:MAG: hypothetical protein QXZ60_05710 [Sulfolobales archaeon]
MRRLSYEDTAALKLWQFRLCEPHISVEVTEVRTTRLASNTPKLTPGEARDILVKLAIDLGKGT